MTVTTATNWYANFGNGSSTGYFAVTAWATGFTPTVGTLRRQTAPTAANERVFICIVSGAVGGSEPTWVVTAGAKTTDSSATWMECTGHPALNGDLTSTPLSSQNRSGAQVLGAIITNNTQDHYFICTTAGTTGSGEPTYSTTTGATTVDSGCTWTCIGAVSSFTTAWAAPFSRMNNAGGNGISRVPSTGTLYVSAASAETPGTTLGGFGTTNNGLGQVICVSNTPSLPPVAADITTGASFACTATGISLQGANVELNGIALTSSANVNPSISLNTSGNGSYVRLRNASLALTNGVRIVLQNITDLINTTFSFSANSQTIYLNGGVITWRDTPSALSGTSPSHLFTMAVATLMLVENVDLSAFSGTDIISGGTSAQGRIVFSHCKLASNVILSTMSFTSPGMTLDFINCDTGSATYNTMRLTYGMSHQISTSVIASGGASDGTTAFSWMFQGGSGTIAFTQPFEAIPIPIWNATTGANRTITIQAACVSTTIPYNDQLWFDAVYFGTAGSTNGTRGSATKATVLSAATQWSASSTLWGSAAAARANSHVYAAGAAIGVSSSGGVVRAFICTTAGTSSGSLPGGYASAVDGSQITDGSAVFTAVSRFAMTLTLSTPQPQSAGYFMVYIRAGLSLSTAYPSFFVDPNPVLS